jgi:apolipoprotein N-acyltransferase
VTRTSGASGGGHDRVSRGYLYRLLLKCARTAWVSCGLGVIAMVPALALRAPQLVTLFRGALVVAFAAVACALMFFACLVMLPGRLTDVLPDGHGPTVRRRVEALFTVVLFDLLDPD